jgi:hypothetical protein
MGPLGTTDMEYRGHVQEIWSFGQLLPHAGDLW